MSKTLTIRYTSDTHGYLYPTSYADMQDRPDGTDEAGKRISA